MSAPAKDLSVAQPHWEMWQDSLQYATQLSKIIDACYSFFFFFYPFFSSLSSDLFESFTFNNPTWLSCLPLSLILANQMEKAREVGMILNISARADFDLVFWMP